MSDLCPVLITADAELAARAERVGVGRIMVDLERIGKFERQKFRDTWISKHRIEDIAPVAAALSRADLMVRINPLHEGSAEEIDQAIGEGARTIMLPMFRTIEEVETVGVMIAGRCRFVPLVETAQAMAVLEDVARSPRVDETFIGLNDLHISLGLDFMFEPLADGMLEEASAALRAIGKPFGFGGIARIGEGDLPAEFILREHARLGSTRVNLSRTFAREGEPSGRAISDDTSVLEREVGRVLHLYDRARLASAEEKAQNTQALREKIDMIVTRIRANRGEAK